MTTGLGLMAGLIAAFLHAVAYLFSRQYMRQKASGILLFLGWGHVLMGVGSLAYLCCFRTIFSLHPATYAVPLLGTTLNYLVGQFGLLWALKYSESSRIAPLLGLKILLLAAWVVLVQKAELGPIQWGAVVLAVGAVYILNTAGGVLSAKSWMGLGLAISGYCFSDLNIVNLVRALEGLGREGPTTAVAMSYALSGLLSLPVLLTWRRINRAEWRALAGFSASWLGAMVCLYVCFAAVGVVYGNILQSTRGLMALLMAPLVAGWGWHHLESRIPRQIYWSRLTGVLLFLAALILYRLGGVR
jgi:drug/metabolite transporter (DMT)-like permease